MMMTTRTPLLLPIHIFCFVCIHLQTSANSSMTFTKLKHASLFIGTYALLADFCPVRAAPSLAEDHQVEELQVCQETPLSAVLSLIFSLLCRILHSICTQEASPGLLASVKRIESFQHQLLLQLLQHLSHIQPPILLNLLAKPLMKELRGDQVESRYGNKEGLERWQKLRPKSTESYRKMLVQATLGIVARLR